MAEFEHGPPIPFSLPVTVTLTKLTREQYLCRSFKLFYVFLSLPMIIDINSNYIPVCSIVQNFGTILNMSHFERTQNFREDLTSTAGWSKTTQIKQVSFFFQLFFINSSEFSVCSLIDISFTVCFRQNSQLKNCFAMFSIGRF